MSKLIQQWADQDWTVGQYTPTESFKDVSNHSCVCLPDLRLVSLSGPAEDLESQKLSDLVSQSPKMYLLLEELCQYHLDPDMLSRIQEVLKKARGES